jgi:hypothetical protein
MADMGAGVGGNQGGVGRPAMCWTPVMFAFVLHRFADLVGEGVKTDKGFKEVHVNSVARQVSEFSDKRSLVLRCTTTCVSGASAGLRFASLRNLMGLCGMRTTTPFFWLRSICWGTQRLT